MGNACRQNTRGFQLVQNKTIFLGPLMLGDVVKHRAALLPRRRNRPFDPHHDRGLALLEERHFAELPGLALEDPREEGVESGQVGRGNAKPEAPLDQPGSFDPQQAGTGDVGLANRPFAVEGQEAYWGEIVEVAVLFQPRLHLVSGLLEFFVLHLQLDLVDLQFMDEALGTGVGSVLARFRALLPQAFLGAAAQLGGTGREVRFHLHERVLVTDYRSLFTARCSLPATE